MFKATIGLDLAATFQRTKVRLAGHLDVHLPLNHKVWLESFATSMEALAGIVDTMLLLFWLGMKLSKVV